MSFRVRACFGLVTLTSLFAFAACGDDDDDVGGSGAAAGDSSEAGSGGSGGTTSPPAGGAADGGAMHGDAALECQVLGELCHAADSGTGPAHECHEVGHVGNAAACNAEFAGCVGVCTGADTGAGGDDPKCAALGSLCHEAGEIDADAEACHDVGHVGNAAACAEQFASCATLCLAILDTIEEGGAGAGGAASGGAATGGAGGAQ